jgi:hypothetical protein
MLNGYLLNGYLASGQQPAILRVAMSRSPIGSNPAVCSGQLVFAGTRVFAQSLLDWLDDGFTLDEFLDVSGSFAFLMPRSSSRLRLEH